jgi:hypothetical protein
MFQHPEMSAFRLQTRASILICFFKSYSVHPGLTAFCMATRPFKGYDARPARPNVRACLLQTGNIHP